MDKLTNILTSLSHLDLEGAVVEKQPYASGLGGSCDVYSAWSVKHNKKVAVKQIRAFLRKDLSLASKLAKEIRIWAKLEHQNVLPLLGYFTEGEGVMPALVSEWMEKGTLHDLMRTFPRGEGQTWVMVLGVALGLAYLHSKEIIHADLKSQNILVSPNDTPLLADFGLSLTLSQSQSTMGATTASTKGTVRWMARELLTSDDGDKPPKHNKMTDIWAFGMVVYELLSWSVPYKNKPNDVLVMMAIVSGKLPEKPATGDHEWVFSMLWYLCTLCWQTRSTSRPTASYIADFLLMNPRTLPAVSEPFKSPSSFTAEGDANIGWSSFLPKEASQHAVDRLKQQIFPSPPAYRRVPPIRGPSPFPTFPVISDWKSLPPSPPPPSVQTQEPSSSSLRHVFARPPVSSLQDSFSTFSATSPSLTYGQEKANSFYDDRVSTARDLPWQPPPNVGDRGFNDAYYNNTVPQITTSQDWYGPDIDGHGIGRGAFHEANGDWSNPTPENIDFPSSGSSTFGLSAPRPFEDDRQTSQPHSQPLPISPYAPTQPVPPLSYMGYQQSTPGPKPPRLAPLFTDFNAHEGWGDDEGFRDI